MSCHVPILRENCHAAPISVSISSEVTIHQWRLAVKIAKQWWYYSSVCSEHELTPLMTNSLIPKGNGKWGNDGIHGPKQTFFTYGWGTVLIFPLWKRKEHAEQLSCHNENVGRVTKGEIKTQKTEKFHFFTMH